MTWTCALAGVEALLGLGALAAAGVDALRSRRLHVPIFPTASRFGGWPPVWADALAVDDDAPGVEAPASVPEGVRRALRARADKHIFARTAWVAALLVAASTAAAPPSRAFGTPEPQPRHVSAASFSARLANVAERNLCVFLPAAGVGKRRTVFISLARSFPNTVSLVTGAVPCVEARAASALAMSHWVL